MPNKDRSELDCVRALECPIDASANINANNFLGHTPLCYVLGQCLPEAGTILRNRSASTMAQQLSALHVAACKDHGILVRFLAECGASLTAVDRGGRMP